MKNTAYLLLILLVYTTFGCNKSTDPFAFYRPSHPQNFITTRGGELYAYTADDSVIVRADYYLKVIGQIKTYGDEILHFGHCWHPTNPNPVIGVDTLMTIDPSDINLNDGDSISYTSIVTRLTSNTRYYLRSYIITGDGSGNPVDTGYNPVVSLITTKDAIDEWFEQIGENVNPGGMRFDAVAFNMGDTIFFGTGNQGQESLLKDLYMYDPVTGSWGPFQSLISIKLPEGTQELKDKLTDGVGFAIVFKDKNAGTTTPPRRCIYVGLGDYGGNNLRADKSRTMLEWDFDRGSWRETEIFSGGVKSGCVSFVIDGKAYVGTGSNSGPTSDWHVYDPALDRDGDDLTLGWKQLLNRPSEINRVGAVAFTINGRGYFGLGRDEHGNFLNDFYEFRPNNQTPTAGTWVRKADFQGDPRANASAFALGDQGYVGTGDNIIGDMESDPPTYTGGIFEDFYRYDPFNDRWYQMNDYTSNKTDRIDLFKQVTRGVGFSSPKNNVGYIGFGIVPDPFPNSNEPNRAQKDLWMYRPYETGIK